MTCVAFIAPNPGNIYQKTLGMQNTIQVSHGNNNEINILLIRALDGKLYAYSWAMVICISI